MGVVFCDPSISWERLELETSNFASRFITEGTNEGNSKLGQRGSGMGHVTYFWNFGTPSISRERLELETSNSASKQNANIHDDQYRSNRNRKYNSNMADVRFLKSEVVITQPCFELSYHNSVLI